MWRTRIAMNRATVVFNHLQPGAGEGSTALGAHPTGAQQRRHNSRRPGQPTKAVIFDMGGVLLPSPGALFRDFDRKLGLPEDTILKQIVKGEYSSNGAWQKLERGELLPSEFSQEFSKELPDTPNKNVNVGDLIYALDEHIVGMFPEMLDAIKCVRAQGIKTALLTNNWLKEPGVGHSPVDKSLFDVVVESCIVGMRKPERRIYEHVLKELNVEGKDAIFLDDIGQNLKAAADVGIRTIKVVNPAQAVAELGEELGFPVQGYAEGTVAVPKHLQLDMKRLKSYLNWVLKLHAKGDQEEPLVRCYEHGQSNPTYFVRYANKNMVLRKKPPGKILPSAHAVEREYKIMKALYDQGVPVPKMLGLCEDNNVLGTPFYMMEHVPGRVFKDIQLKGMTRDERRKIYTGMVDTLVKIHGVNVTEAGLDDYGKKGGYMKRNFNRWAKQYEAAKTHEVPSMNKLLEWLPKNMPSEEQELCTIVHGDYRLDNLILDPQTLEVKAVLDWELSTLGDPLSDLATNCLTYYIPAEGPMLAGFGDTDFKTSGIPSLEEYIQMYSERMRLNAQENWEFYVAFVCFRFASIIQGVYKRSTQGQASSSTASQAGVLTATIADLGWNIASKKSSQPAVSAYSANPSGTRSYSTTSRSTGAMSQRNYSSTSSREIPGTLPMSVSALSPRVQDLHRRVREFINTHCIPLERELHEYHEKAETKWTIHPKVEQLKARAREEGLWNLFMPLESDPELRYGAGLTNLEYAFLCEEMGKCAIAPEVFNCSAPDTGNMEVLVKYGTEEQKQRWLTPLLKGEIRSCFGMTEPAVASSDATNIESSIMRRGNKYIINGRKWWTSGAMDPRCKVCIFMGKTDRHARTHNQQSMILVPMDAPGVKIIRPLYVFGSEDAPHGHAEVNFENVEVPLENMLLGEGRGFEIAQGRLGPGRIHHCMRLIGMAERSLDLMIKRTTSRIAFGKPIAAQASIQQDIAKSRIEIEQCRLLTLKAAHMMDTVGNKTAAPEIAMIKIAAPNMTQRVCDRAMQAFGGMGVSTDTPIAHFFAWARVVRLADGPDEVHMRSLARMEIKANELQSRASKL